MLLPYKANRTTNLAIDALLLSVLPILATWQAFTGLGWTGSWFGHIAMHVASVLHGPATTVQLPPHY